MLVAKISPDFRLKNIKPFVAFGFGIMHSTLDTKISAEGSIYGNYLSGSYSESDSDTAGCFKVGAGVDYFINDTISIGLELDYVVGFVSHSIAGQDIIDECNYVNCTLGVAYHF